MRYVPRTPPSSLSALEVNRRARELNPDPEVGDEGSVSPDVFMAAMQNRFDQHAAGVQGKREFVKGAAKLGWVTASDAGKAKARAMPGKAYGAAKDLVLGKRNIPILQKGGENIMVNNPAFFGGEATAVTRESAGKAAQYLSGKAPAGRAGGLLGKAGTAGKAAFATGKTALAAAAASPAAPFVAVGAALLALNRSKEGTKLADWTNKRLGTKGQFKNLFSPWKWRI
jgi:hypothetical protein